MLDEVLKTLQDADTVARLRGGGAEVVTSKSPEEFAEFMKAQLGFWANLVKETGVKAN